MDFFRGRKRRARRGSSSSGAQYAEEYPVPSPPTVIIDEDEEDVEYHEQGSLDQPPPHHGQHPHYGPLPEHADRYHTLSQFEMVATRFPAMRPISDMGLRPLVTHLFDNVHWGSLLTLKYNSWTGPTLEFLASVQKHTEDGPARITFRYAGESYVVPYARIALAFGAPYPCDYDSSQRQEYHREYRPESFWRAITHSRTFDSQHLKQALITHPALRIAARIVASTVMGRGETGPLLLKELYTLWCMITGKATVCLTTFLVERLVLRKQPANICLGGMISIIIDKCTVAVLPHPSAALPSHLMDRASL